MNTRQLECFCHIAQNRSFSQAANALFVSQSAVTQQINALEKELNFRLFDRSTKSVQLTPAGEVFYTYARLPLPAAPPWPPPRPSGRIGPLKSAAIT